MNRTVTRYLLGFGFLALAYPVAFTSPQDLPRVVHVFVALADNEHQGIIPVPAVIGNGSDPARNLYWGAAFGIKTFFKKSDDWETEWCGHGPKGAILERRIFKNRKDNVYMVADAYEGSQIREAVGDFLSAAAGANAGNALVKKNNGELAIPTGGRSDVVAYVGHDAFMDFQITPIAGKKGSKTRKAIILACASKAYFSAYLKATGAEPLLWTTGLMAPEAYTLKATLDGWIRGESDEEIRVRAAQAYDRYQKCGARAASRLFATGW